MELSVWIVAWVLVTSGAVILAYARMTIGMHDMLGMHIMEPDTDAFYQKQQDITAKLRNLDRFGMTLTATSAVLALVILVLWAMAQGGGY